MCHSLANLEYHHFKYRQFLKAGDVHIHYFGTATLSFADGIQAQVNDEFEIEMKEFGHPQKQTCSYATRVTDRFSYYSLRNIKWSLDTTLLAVHAAHKVQLY